MRHGTKVWVHDRDSAWIPAELLESSGNKVTVATASGKKVRVLFLPNSRRLRVWMAVPCIIRMMNLWGDLFCRLLLFRRTCFPGTQMKKSMAESKIWRDWLTWMSRGCCTISEEDIRWTIFMWVFIEWICWYLCGQLGFFHVLSPYLLMMRWTWDYSCVIVLCDIENV